MMKEEQKSRIYEALARLQEGKQSDDVQPDQKTYTLVHLAAAMREQFTLETLHKDSVALGFADSEEELDQLMDQVLDEADFSLDKSGEQMHWHLSFRTRRDVFREMVGEKKVNPEMIPLLPGFNLSETYLWDMLTGKIPDWQSFNDIGKLRLLLRNAILLRDFVEIPPPQGLRKRIAWLETMKPFHTLTENFRGRKSELAQLRKYIDYLPAEDHKEGVKRLIFRGLERVRRLLSLREHPLLMISGIGGVGKSALLAKFILDHVGNSDQGTVREGLIFVYIDFDHGTVSLRDPLDILRETARQLALQFPDYEEEMSGIARDVTDLSRNIQLGHGSGSYGNPYQSTLRGPEKQNQKSQVRFDLRSDDRERGELLESMAQVWERLPEGVRESPFMLVLDSFEEVHRLGPGVVSELFDFLEEWSEYLPRFRPVLAGRAPVEGLPIKPTSIHLREFDEESAIAFLQARGVTETELAAYVVREFGRHPLSLKLAAEYIKKQSPSREELRNPNKQGLLRNRIDTNLAQNDLFRRNLQHINDPEAQKIAFPGLVVRRITPDVIQQVLAGPCHLGEVDEQEANRLFDVLAKETFLVRPLGNRELEFRKDLRRLVLGHVLVEDPARTKLIHDAAIAHYENGSSTRDQAEYVYHRLLRGDAPQEMEKLLHLPGMEDYISGGLEELPTGAHLYLAGIWSIPVPPEVRALGDLEQWETNLANELDSAQYSGFMEETLRLYVDRLNERSERSRLSPLPFREARLWLELGDLDRAKEAAEHAAAIDALKDESEERMLLNSLRADVLERRGEYAAAAEAILPNLTGDKNSTGLVFDLMMWVRLQYRQGMEKVIDAGEAMGYLDHLRKNSDLEPLRIATSKSSVANSVYSQLLVNILVPLKTVLPAAVSFHWWYDQLRWIGKDWSELSRNYNVGGLNDTLNKLELPPQPEKDHRFFFSADEFDTKFKYLQSICPDDSALSNLAQKVFNDRLGNVVRSNVYVSAIYEFALALEMYGRWGEVD